MEIRNRLYINVAIWAVGALVIASVVVMTVHRIDHAREELEIASQIAVVAFERSAFRTDYLQSGDERSRTQWLVRSEQINSLLKSASSKFSVAEDRKTIAEINKSNEATVDLFTQIVENRQKTASDPGTAARSLETETRLTRLLNMRLYSYVLNVLVLRDAAVMRMSSVMRQASWVIVAVLSGVTAVAVRNSWSMVRTIADRIRRLQKGASIIGEGNLEHRIRIEGGDEFAGLARSFNAMTEKLHGSYRELEKEIEERTRIEKERERLLSEVRRSNRELEQFAYAASHDLQEPLRMVAGYVRLLEQRYKGRLDRKADKYIYFAADGAERMQKLIEGLLEYSRIGTRGSDFKTVDVNKVFSAAVSNLSASIRENRAIVSKDDLPAISGDETQLVQLLQNLIGNAVKYRKPDRRPSVHVSARREGTEYLFSVQDNGIGIDSEYFDRVFQVFQRLHTRSEYQGTGIGLALCKRIVERHHGRIWVESAPGRGSTFFFTIQT